MPCLSICMCICALTGSLATWLSCILRVFLAFLGRPKWLRALWKDARAMLSRVRAWLFAGFTETVRGCRVGSPKGYLFSY